MRLSRLTVAFLSILSLGMVARADDDDDDDRYQISRRSTALGPAGPWRRRPTEEVFQEIGGTPAGAGRGILRAPGGGRRAVLRAPGEAAERRRKAEEEYFERLEEAYEEGRGGFDPGVRGGFPGVYGGYPGGGYGRGGYGGRFARRRVWLSRPDSLWRFDQGLPSPLVNDHPLRPRKLTAPSIDSGWSAGLFVWLREILRVSGPRTVHPGTTTVGPAGRPAPESLSGISRSPPSGHHLAHDDRSQS